MVLLAPFLTSCQEECPITTAALLDLQRTLAQDGLSKKVAILEATVDPAQGHAVAHGGLRPPHRIDLAPADRFACHVGLPLALLRDLLPEGGRRIACRGLDWQTHQPYTYDVNHSDGFILLNTDLDERFVAGGMTKIGQIPANLQKLLDSEGKSNLENPGAGTWTVTDALNAIGWVMGRSVPGTS